MQNMSDRELRAREIVTAKHALRDGHFVLHSGEHSNQYLDKNRVFSDIDALMEISELIAWHFLASEVEVVVGPQSGGAKLAAGVAAALSHVSGEKVSAVYAEKTSTLGKFMIPSSQEHELIFRRILVVDDVFTTGQSVNGVLDVLLEFRPQVVGLGVFANRSANRPIYLKYQLPEYFAALNLNLPSWARDECPYCRKNDIPVDTTVGYGQAFVKLEEAKHQKETSGRE